MTWVQTVSGIPFDLLDPKPDMVRGDDIAHALSRIVRFNGHTSGEPYSVAHHSMLVADLLASWGAPPAIVREGLLHDAAEAYYGDIVSPLKRAMVAGISRDVSDFETVAARIDEVVRQAASAGLGTPTPPRLEVAVGTLDPRLQLAPCEKVEVYLPAGHRAWGRTRAGVRCLSGPVRWNVFVPLTVRVFAPAVQAASALPAGTTLDASHLRVAEADWAAVDSAAFADPQPLVGRTLQRALPAGAALRESDLQRRRWFAIGDIVRVVATGPGYAVSGDGVALTPGIEGSPARVRTEGGRVVSGMPVGERRLAVQP